MKTKRFPSASIRAAVLLLAGLLLAPGLPAARLKISINWERGAGRAKPSSEVAKALTQQTAEVQKNFERTRGALRPQRGPRGESFYQLDDVAGLVHRTAQDLDQTLVGMGEPGLEALRAWEAEELRPVQDQLARPPRRAAASLPFRLSGPRAVAVFASFGGLPLPRLASAKAAAPKPPTIPAEKTNQLLDQVGKVVSQIFSLAAHDDLEVKLWIGSTPAERAKFTFWPPGQIRGSGPAGTIVQTDGNREHVWRGYYYYSAAWAKGPVTRRIEYPNPVGAPAALQSQRLDLVTGSNFFCCRFNEQYCHHVASEKECR